MTPLQKIRREILLQAAKNAELAYLAEGLTDANVDQRFYDLSEYGDDWLHDHLSDFRSGQVETGLPSQSSRHYEAKEVAIKCCDGSWVGWTYWYGGGKHGEPRQIPWMSDAYDIEMTEEEKLVLVRTFKKK